MTGNLGVLLAAAVFFIASHLVLSLPPLRGALVDRIGENAFRGAYATVALAALVWLVRAYNAAPYIELWPVMPWTRHLPLIVMPFAAILLAAGLSTRNPTAMYWDAPPTGDPADGILKITRHPVMWAITLWALAHMPLNGDAASLMFFGAFAGLALAGMPSIDRRRATIGAAWGPIAMTTSVLPFAALASGRARLRFAEIGVWRIAAGAALYTALLFAHEAVIGASPL